MKRAEKGSLTVQIFSQSQMHIITSLNNLEEHILQWIPCHTIWKLVLCSPDEIGTLETDIWRQETIPCDLGNTLNIQLLRVSCKWSLIDVWDLKLFEVAFMWDFKEKYLKTSTDCRDTPRARSLVMIYNMANSIKLWTEVQNAQLHIT